MISGYAHTGTVTRKLVNWLTWETWYRRVSFQFDFVELKNYKKKKRKKELLVTLNHNALSSNRTELKEHLNSRTSNSRYSGTRNYR